MSNSRSPRYPNISLNDAVLKTRMIYEKEHMSPTTPEIAAEAMGYRGLNGASLKSISSLRKYGILEGRGDDLRISKDAQTLVIDSPESPEYRDALRRCALNPEVFSDLKRQFPGRASERNITVYLERQGFKPVAAALAAQNYKETMTLVGQEQELDDNASKADSPMEQTRPTRLRRIQVAPEVGGVPDGAMQVLLNGTRLEIVASVDLKGLRKLRKVLDAQESVLAMLAEQENDEPETSSAT